MRSGMDARCMNSVISVGVMGLVMTLAGVDGWCPAAVAAAADTPAEQSVTTAPAQPPAVPCINGYAAATAAAQEAGAMLLVSVEPEVSDTDLVGSYLQQSDLQARFMASPTPWVFCRLPIDGLTAIDGEPIRLIDHWPNFVRAQVCLRSTTRTPRRRRETSRSTDELCRSCRESRASTTALPHPTSTNWQTCPPVRSRSVP